MKTGSAVGVRPATPTGNTRPSSDRAGVVVGVAVLAVASIVHVLTPIGIVGDITYYLVVAGAAVFAALAARLTPPALRTFALLVAGAVGLSALGDLAWWAVELRTGEAPEVFIGDVFWIGSYVALLVALLHFLAVDRGRRIDPDALIDLAVIAVVAVILVGQVSLEGIFADTSVSATTQLVWAAYPALDAVLLAFLVRSVIRDRRRPAGGWLFAIGLAAWLAADFAYLYEPEPSSGAARWLDLGWMLGAAALAGSVWQARSVEPRLSTLPRAGVGPGRVLLGLLPLTLPAAVEVVGFARGENPNPLPLAVATCILIGLAYARSVRLLAARDAERDALVASERYYSALSESSADAVVVLDYDGVIQNDAPRLAAMLGRPDEPTRGVNAFDFVRPVEDELVAAGLAELWQTRGVVREFEILVTHADGTERWFGVRAVNLADDPAVGGAVVNFHDVTDRRRIEQAVVHQSLHDSLTGLPNRALFDDRVERALRRGARGDLEVVVVRLDLDRFKAVNDRFGYHAADGVLQEFAGRLLVSVHGDDTVGRLSGDEFAVLVERRHGAVDDARDTVARIQRHLAEPFEIGDDQVRLAASIGIASSDEASSGAVLLRNADTAMVQAKLSGRDRCVVFDPALQAATDERRALEADLPGALAAEQFELVYQPIVDLHDGRLIGFEALLRWRHPTRGVVAPDEFIPALEQSGAIVDVGRWVLGEACATAAAWQRDYPHRPQLSMSVNLSSRQVGDPTLVDDVAGVLQATGLTSSSLTLELTETALVEDADRASSQLHDLRGLGVRIAIDDFGTGYSSLGYLRQFAVDTLKIDRSFVSTIVEQGQLPPILRGLLDLSRTLGLDAVAEGIELDAQRETLAQHGCELGQGYLFARPLSREAADALVAESATAGGATPYPVSMCPSVSPIAH